jgi:hypothetical protein
MNKKTGNFFEQHVEKIVLAVTGLVCIWLLVTRVVLSPNSVVYEGKKFSAGSIDAYISTQAELLENKLNRQTQDKPPYKPRLDEYLALMKSAVNNIDANVILPQPNKVAEMGGKRTYHIPTIGTLNDVRVEHIRAVAYVPVTKINEENTYDIAEHKAKDIDLVTVEAEFDVAALCKNFLESFAGKDVREEWRNPALAVPVFAAVELQRQELLDGGSWSDWEVVPRTQIDHYKKLFEVIEDVKNLPSGGLRVQLLRFSGPEVKMNLLQPRAYVIASPREEWFPPSLHKEFVRYQQAARLQEKKEAKATEKEARGRDRQQLLAAHSSRLAESKAAVSPLDEEKGVLLGAVNPSAATKRTPTVKAPAEKPEKVKEKEAVKPTFDAFGELSKIALDGKTDFAKMHGPLVLWAHDDTVEPAKIYRYRIRLGVFNPIAGTIQFSKQDEALKNKVILWSEFSDETESITIPGVLYFFPLEVQEAAKTVTIQVAAHAMDCWHTKDFMVRLGEVIGKEAGQEAAGNAAPAAAPQTIDYSTAAVLTDIVPVNDWLRARTLTSRRYFDMLYTYDGVNISRMPIRQKYWLEDLQAKFNEIKRSIKEPKEPLRNWDAAPAQRGLPIHGPQRGGGLDG